ncbi:hypothetical protein Golax_004574, partial [Gossypium laxum]|nr:hypothetical protein [Gossypium laxum]
KLQKEKEERSDIGANIFDFRSIYVGYQECLFRHASRQANGVSHMLATEGLRREEITYLFNVSSSFCSGFGGCKLAMDESA